MNIDPEALPFARKLKESERHGLHEGASLAEVVSILLDVIYFKVSY